MLKRIITLTGNIMKYNKNTRIWKFEYVSPGCDNKICIMNIVNLNYSLVISIYYYNRYGYWIDEYLKSLVNIVIYFIILK